MKTTQEIEAEARRITALGRGYQDEQRELSGIPVATHRVLLQLPEAPRAMQTAAQPVAEGLAASPRERSVEIALERDLPVYRLVERETAMAASSRSDLEATSSIVMSSRSAFDVLQAGYELIEEERLGALVAPYAARRADRDEVKPVDGEAIAELEAIVETELLPFADQLRTKTDILAFLEGRLEADEFVAGAIHRHRARNCQRETVAERHEMKLTIDES